MLSLAFLGADSTLWGRAKYFAIKLQKRKVCELKICSKNLKENYLIYQYFWLFSTENAHLSSAKYSLCLLTPHQEGEIHQYNGKLN